MNVTITSQTSMAGKVDQEIWMEEPSEPRPTGPLTQLAAGPWRSLGRYLDYSNWADRDRFVELDRAIEANAQLDAIEELYDQAPAFSVTLDLDSEPSPFAAWGVRPIGGGQFKKSRRAYAIQ